MCTSPGLILWCALGAKALGLCRAGQALSRRGTECARAEQQHQLLPSPRWSTRGALAAQRGRRGSTRECSFPQPKIEGRALPCFWLRNRRGISPPTSPYVGSTSMEGNRLQNHRGNKSAMRTARAAKNARGKQLWLGGNAWGDGGQS